MKERKLVMRTCCQTRECLEKKDLIRIVRTLEGNVEIDPIGKANGRGAYLKKEASVIEAAKKSHCLDKKLEVRVPDEIYDKLLEVLNG